MANMSDEEYLIKYQIPHLIDALLLDMVQEKPGDVITFFMDWLSKRKVWESTVSASLFRFCVDRVRGVYATT